MPGLLQVWYKARYASLTEKRPFVASVNTKHPVPSAKLGGLTVAIILMVTE